MGHRQSGLPHTTAARLSNLCLHMRLSPSTLLGCGASLGVQQPWAELGARLVSRRISGTCGLVTYCPGQ